MFITVNRRVGGMPLRLAVQSIAYIELPFAGANIRLTDGTTLQVSQTAEEIEQSVGHAAITRASIDEIAQHFASLLLREPAPVDEAKDAADQRVDRATRRGRGTRA
ncbi:MULTISPECIES: hypothetical protein [Sphingomonas]|uniref:hypothetical protein n=1 Tax=Sphingomonas TaxID=13687 RepID=UPI00254F445D|nr:MULTISPECIES: hypothetical protein [Sphingomonas]MDK8187768.1 hypothetical protein [Sphingomonas zeae]MDK8217622.1 hypothetical protein [Sphingomonas sp. UMB7805-LC452B]